MQFLVVINFLNRCCERVTCQNEYDLFTTNARKKEDTKIKKIKISRFLDFVFSWLTFLFLKLCVLGVLRGDIREANTTAVTLANLTLNRLYDSAGLSSGSGPAASGSGSGPAAGAATAGSSIGFSSRSWGKIGRYRYDMDIMMTP